MKLLTVKPCF